MSFTYCIEKNLKWEEGSVKNVESDGSAYYLFVQFSSHSQHCPYCHNHSLHIKDYREQKVLIAHWNTMPVYALIHKRRYICPCCHKTFYDTVPGLEHYQRRTSEMKNLILKSCAEVQSFSSAARSHGVSVSTVIRYFDRIVLPRPAALPEVLSLDEFRGNARGQKYQVAVNNPVSHDVLDILPKRSTVDIIRYFMQFSRKQRLKVKFVVMDLSKLFRKVVQTVFPNAVIVGDRFHIQRLVVWGLERVRKTVQNLFKEHRIYFKKNKHILNKRGDHLTPEEAVCLREILNQSVDLRRAYALKEAFYRVVELKEEESVREFLGRWIELVKESGVKELQSVVTTFREWGEEIVAGLTKPYSNGFTEGMNNKIKVLKRNAYGYVNFERFRSRILLLSMVKYK